MPVKKEDRPTGRLFRGTLLLALAFLAPVLLGPWPIAEVHATAVVFDSYATSNQSGDDSLGTGSNEGQCFTASATGFLTQAKFMLRNAVGSGILRARLFQTIGTYGSSCVRTGSALAVSDDFSTSVITGSYQFFALTFSGGNQIQLNSGSIYGITIWLDSGTSVLLGTDITAPTHGGNAFRGIVADSTTDLPFEVDGDTVATSQSIIVSQCYGNCGNPAVTVVNTNSTNSLNFNQSITIFYQAQSALQGTIKNITAQIAKAYTNNVFFTLAIYRVDRQCTNTNLPFTPQCPGQYAHRQTFIISTPKGKLTAATNIAIDLGQWFGIAFTATFSPPYPNAVALNDTNTAVQLYQTPGSADNFITSFTPLASSFKPALYSWITGTQVIVTEPTPTPGGQICPGLDCILPNIVNSFCTTLTAACQTGSSLFFIIILSIITILTMVYAFGTIVPSVSIARLGVAELSMLVVLAWTFTFASFSLISPYVVITIFMMVALLFGKKVQDYI